MKKKDEKIDEKKGKMMEREETSCPSNEKIGQDTEIAIGRSM
jgi:hypothetical protein